MDSSPALTGAVSLIDAPPSATSANIPTMSVAQASWLAVVVACAVAVVLLALNGYTGYSITVGVVGAAAAVNLS